MSESNSVNGSNASPMDTNPLSMKDSSSSILEKISYLETRAQQYKADKGDEFIRSSLDKLHELKLLTSNDEWFQKEETWCAVIENYIRALLDLTFFEENKLVDADFKGEGMEEKVQDIIDKLTDAENICNRSSKGSVTEVLGLEYAECLLWRKGALLYMFCHQKQLDHHWLCSNKDLYLQLLKRGISELKLMLLIRQRDEELRQACGDDADTIQLVEKGIFSDTHLLALMYVGEMCYWCVKAFVRESSGSQSSSHNEEFDPVTLGQQYLEQYIEAADILKSVGWTTQRARELLDFLNSFRGPTWKNNPEQPG